MKNVIPSRVSPSVRRAISSALLAAVWSVAPATARAQDPFADPSASPDPDPANPLESLEPAAIIVRDIEVRYIGKRTVDESRILANMSTKVGDELTQEKLDEDIKSLYESGNVDDVRILTEDAPGGVRLVVIVSARSVLGEVSFEGNVGLSDNRLRRATDLEVGKSFDDADLQIAQSELSDLYRSRGYSGATLSYRIEDMPEGFSRVVFAIDEGQKALLKDILFEGNTVFSDKELAKQVRTREKSLWRLFIGGGKIDYTVLEDDVDRIRDFYGDSGYIDADVEVRTERITDEKVNLIFVITEGEPYTIASVALSGLSVFAPDELYPVLVTEAGQAYSVSALRTDTKTLRDFYGSKGYADVSIDTRIDRAEGRQLAVTFNVEEGSKSYIRKINIRGNDKTKDKVIRRELAVAPGDEFNLVRVDASRRRLETLQYFSEIDIFPSDTGDPGYKDLNISVAEKSTGSLNFGVGFSSIDSVVGFVDVIQTNFDLFDWGSFTGGGQRFQIGAKIGTERRDLILSLYEPWFNDYRLGLGGELYYRDLLYLSDDYDQRNAGGRLYLRKPLGQHAYLQPEYRLQKVKVDVDNDASPELLAEDGDFLQSELAISYNYDRRDSNLITREGHRITVGADASGGFLGGDVDTYGFEFSGSKYFLLPFDTVLSFRGEYAVVDELGSSDGVPIFERVFLGGANDLRGFDYRDVGPKDASGEPLGGRSGVFGSVEYTFPIYAERVRGAVFYDVGFVDEDAWKFSGDWNSNVGVGVRLYLPIGPIRVDFGIPVQSDEFNDSNGKFNFNLGYTF